MNKLDFIAVGDVVTDAFIRIKEAKVNCDVNEENCQISMRFGDKIPYESVTVVKGVGNSPNASVSASRLGLNTGLVTDLGDDEVGAEIVDYLRGENINTNYFTVHSGQKSNYHYVLWYESDRTILVKHEHYKYKWPILNTDPAPTWLYLSSLGEGTEDYHQAIIEYLKAHEEIKLAFQPGTFQLKMGDKLKEIYKRAEVVFMNVEEAKRLLQTNSNKIEKLLEELSNWGPNLVVVTDGPRGAYLRKGDDDWFMPIYPDIAPPLERTGAGDAFASTFTSALALGRSPLEALTWAPINSMSVVQKVGAQEGLLSQKQLLEYLKSAPPDYRAKKI